MTALVALVRREFIEHRAVFLIAPLALLGLALLAALYTVIPTAQGDMRGDMASSLQFYETIYALSVAGWWTYLLIALFFYYSDAFSSDARNNAMLFWKSMPVSDLKMLGSKVAAAMTLFPVIIIVAMGVTGVIAYLPALSAGNLFPGYAPPSLAEALSAWAQISAIGIVYFVIGLLWYLPFMAWVGMLGTIFARWSIPLAFLIPAVFGLFETLVLRRFGAPMGGHLLAFLRERTQLDFGGLDLRVALFSGEFSNAGAMISRMAAGTDWISLVGGVAVAVILVGIAAEYRRRYVLT